jgi:hypothetical protein
VCHEGGVCWFARLHCPQLPWGGLAFLGSKGAFVVLAMGRPVLLMVFLGAMGVGLRSTNSGRQMLGSADT